MSDTNEEGASDEGKSIKDIRKQWMEHEDFLLAKKLQKQEYESRTQENRDKNRVMRDDVPLARSVQQEEQDRIERERLQQLADLQKQMEEDEVYARRLQTRLHEETRLSIQRKRQDPNKMPEHDEDYARQLQAHLQEEARLSFLRKHTGQSTSQNEDRTTAPKLHVHFEEDVRLPRPLPEDEGNLGGRDPRGEGDENARSPEKARLSMIRREDEVVARRLQSRLQEDARLSMKIRELQDERLARQLEDQAHL